jgi:phosphohistidine phosphatase SixA
MYYSRSHGTYRKNNNLLQRHRTYKKYAGDRPAAKQINLEETCMKFQSRVLCTIAFALATLAPTIALADAKFIYLTRHAEKSSTGSDPALTAAGQTRAQNIAAMLKKAKITSVFSTATVRTQQTAAPLAGMLSVPVQTYDYLQLSAFAQQLLALPGNSLVVGHSDTTPDLIAMLGGEAVPAIAETEFDRLYQVAIGQDGDVTTTLMNSLPSVTVIPCETVTWSKPGLTAAKDTWLYFTITVPECANTLTVNMTAGTGDADLYTRPGLQPTTAAGTYDCRPYKTNQAESCIKADPVAGVWHIGLRAYGAFSNVTLTATAAP